jgi:hypothetical protein
MISPASPCTRTIRLVVIDNDKRKVVVKRMRLGNVENSIGELIWIAAIISRTERPILMAISTSASIGGIGITIMASVRTSIPTTATSCRSAIFPPMRWNAPIRSVPPQVDRRA